MIRKEIPNKFDWIIILYRVKLYIFIICVLIFYVSYRMSLIYSKIFAKIFFKNSQGINLSYKYFSININVNLFGFCQNILHLSLIGGSFHFYIHIAFPLFRRIRNTCQQWLQHGNTQQRLPVPTLSEREKALLFPMVVALTFFTA